MTVFLNIIWYHRYCYKKQATTVIVLA